MPLPPFTPVLKLVYIFHCRDHIFALIYLKISYLATEMLNSE